MAIRSLYAVGAFCAAHSALGQTPPTNLPPATPGIFTIQSSIIIDGPIESVWNVLLDFPAYPDWNPFVRSQVVTNAFSVPLADQTPHTGLNLIIQSQVPPLPLPVNASTPPNPLNAQSSFENITAIDRIQHRAAWGTVTPMLSAERWQALSIVNGRQTFYEAREVFAGPEASVVQTMFGQGLQEGFDAQAETMKTRVESSRVDW